MQEKNWRCHDKQSQVKPEAKQEAEIDWTIEKREKNNRFQSDLKNLRNVWNVQRDGWRNRKTPSGSILPSKTLFNDSLLFSLGPARFGSVCWLFFMSKIVYLEAENLLLKARTCASRRGMTHKLALSNLLAIEKYGSVQLLCVYSL